MNVKAGSASARVTQTRSARDRLGLTQAEWAIVVGVHPLTVSKWERAVLAPAPRAEDLAARARRLPPDAGKALGAAVRAAVAAGGTTEALRVFLDGTACGSATPSGRGNEGAARG